MRLALVAVIAAIGASVGAFPVLGHAGLESSDPADGATISTPYTLVATFEEEFDPERSSLTIFDAADVEVAQAEVDSDDPSMMFVELPALEPGEYIVRWTTVTPDDNGIERGVFTFKVAAEPSAGPSAAPTAGAPSPAPTGSTGGEPSASNDVLLALALAGVALVGIGLFVFMRMRR